MLLPCIVSGAEMILPCIARATACKHATIIARSNQPAKPIIIRPTKICDAGWRLSVRVPAAGAGRVHLGQQAAGCQVASGRMTMSRVWAGGGEQGKVRAIPGLILQGPSLSPGWVWEGSRDGGGGAEAAVLERAELALRGGVMSIPTITSRGGFTPPP